MFDGETDAVECNRVDLKWLSAAILAIAYHWTADGGKLQSNLVLAARMQLDLDECALFLLPQYAIAEARMLRTARSRRHDFHVPRTVVFQYPM